MADLNSAGICGAISPRSPRQKQVMCAREWPRCKTARSFAIRLLSPGAG